MLKNRWKLILTIVKKMRKFKLDNLSIFDLDFMIKFMEKENENPNYFHIEIEDLGSGGAKSYNRIRDKQEYSPDVIDFFLKKN